MRRRFTTIWGMTDSPPRRTTFIREWRTHQDMTLDELASRVGMDKGNLSKMERGLLPYTQLHLEKISEELGVRITSLIERHPMHGASIFDTIEKADPATLRQIEAAADAILKARSQG
jgi:transcriptional regulator with XRE-family HTH domain